MVECDIGCCCCSQLCTCDCIYFEVFVFMRNEFNESVFLEFKERGIYLWQIAYLSGFADYKFSRLCRTRITAWDCREKARLFATFELLRKADYDVDSLLSLDLSLDLELQHERLRDDIYKQLVSQEKTDFDFIRCDVA